MIHRQRQSLVLGTYGPLELCRVKVGLGDLATHLYMVGRTKQGKSKLLEYLALQLIRGGQGVGVLDPHSDLADDLLAALHKDLEHPVLRERIIYFEPGRSDYILPFNVLNSPHAPYTTAQHVLEAFRRTWPESLREAPRFSNILLAALLVLIEHHETLAQLPRFLTDPSYREPLLERSRDLEAVRFFRDRYDRWGREQAVMVESVLNKVGALTLNPTLRRILGARENRLPFRQMMDEGKVLICDLGRVDAETRRLLGSLITTGMEQAALSRKDTPREARRPFYLLLDEFQDFSAHEGSAQTLAHILSECRKFGLHLALAHQAVGQLTDGQLRGALENAQLKVVFSSGRQTAQELVGQLHAPRLTQIKHEVLDPTWRERTHPTYYPLAEQWELLTQEAQRLPERHALAVLPRRHGAVRMRTVTLPRTRLAPGRLARLQTELAARVGVPAAALAGDAQREPAGPTSALDYYEPIQDPEAPAAPSGAPCRDASSDPSS